MVDNKNTNTEEKKNNEVEHENELTFDQQVLEKIANYALKDIDGILELKGGIGSSIKNFFGQKDETKGVSAEVGKKEVALDLEVIAEYGKNIPEAFKTAIDKITKDVQTMTSLKVVEFNMHVDDIMTREEYERRQREKKDKENEKKRRENQERQYDERYDDRDYEQQGGPRVR